MGGDSDNEGRVEVCVEADWKTVCNDTWDSEEAKVVCRHVGYTAGGQYNN